MKMNDSYLVFLPRGFKYETRTLVLLSYSLINKAIAPVSIF